MRNFRKYFFAAGVGLTLFAACKPDNILLVTGTPGTYISNFVLKKNYTGSTIELTSDRLYGATSIKGVVVSDASAGNMPAGLVALQNGYKIGNSADSIRGIFVNLGSSAANYVVGDSLHINVLGASMGKKDGALQIFNIDASKVEKVASGKTFNIPVVNSKMLRDSPVSFEGSVITLANAIVKPEPTGTEVMRGEHTVDDSFGESIIHTENNATFADIPLVASANFTGVVLYKEVSGVNVPQIWVRNANDIFELPVIKPSAIIITGYLPNPANTSGGKGDGNWEYIQFMATKDINFATTPFSVVTTNNAGANTPAGVPLNGWATGDLRTYKFNLTSGTVRKGEVFYVGGSNKNIWGFSATETSTDISDAKWIVSKDYTELAGDDFGTKTNNLLANSGNIAGIAVFEGITVTSATVPLDVIMYGGNGNYYQKTPVEVGYRITNTEFYTTINPSNRSSQVFYGAGSNTSKLGFQTEQAGGFAGGSFVRLGGVYNATTGRWEAGRSRNNITMSFTSTRSDIETGDDMTKLID
ncbi:DUF5689 domain-containing protein [Pedobacter sp. UBA4863]|uniref:DUF5689 domain-containing protein n=1 Tax=Pedobacter sp. UBA4863 TaxID=1947060 RepID=UPI0025E0E0BD|nr:DUF5689 domain-containing protein [Pedobacter sp. UBA4863]